MKKLIILLFMGIICSDSYSDNRKLIEETQQLVLQIFDFYDSNPIHQQETDIIKNKFQELLLKHNLTSNSPEYKEEIATLFSWLYIHSSCYYEDSPDLLRMKIRRALCFASIALISDYDKAYTFLEYAKLSLIGSIDEPDYNVIQNEFIGILLIELLLKTEEGSIYRDDMQNIEKFVDMNKDAVNNSYYKKTRELIKGYNEIVIQFERNFYK